MNKLKNKILVSMAVAVAENDTIGYRGGIPWQGKLKGDQALFKLNTMGKAVIMGRSTWYSIPEKYRPLPNRMNIVLTSEGKCTTGERTNCSSLKDGIKAAIKAGHKEVVLMGGQRVYEEGMGICSKIYLTSIHECFEGDTFFAKPTWPFEVVSSREFTKEKGREYDFLFQELIRKQ